MSNTMATPQGELADIRMQLDRIEALLHQILLLLQAMRGGALGHD